MDPKKLASKIIDGLKVKRNAFAIAIYSEADFEAVKAAVADVGDRYSIQFSDVIGCDSEARFSVEAIAPGSPIRARVAKPWHALAVGESAFMRDSSETKEKSLRCYVSLHAAKVYQRITVSKEPGGYRFERKA